MKRPLNLTQGLQHPLECSKAFFALNCMDWGLGGRKLKRGAACGLTCDPALFCVRRGILFQDVLNGIVGNHLFLKSVGAGFG